MIKQTIFLTKYRWSVNIYYEAEPKDAMQIIQNLIDIGCTGSTLEKTKQILFEGHLNNGLTYSNFCDCESVMVIGKTTSAKQFQNTFDHEKGHLCRHISQAMNIDPYSEEAQYLAGDIGEQMYSIAMQFMCVHCRET